MDKLSKALNEEVDFLTSYPGFVRDKLDWSTFDPSSYFSCFLGQGFGVGSAWSEALRKISEYRKQILGIHGKIEDIILEHRSQTILENWALIKWRKNQHHAVKLVFDYLKEGGEKPEVAF